MPTVYNLLNTYPEPRLSGEDPPEEASAGTDCIAALISARLVIFDMAWAYSGAAVMAVLLRQSCLDRTPEIKHHTVLVSLLMSYICACSGGTAGKDTNSCKQIQQWTFVNMKQSFGHTPLASVSCAFQSRICNRSRGVALHDTTLHEKTYRAASCHVYTRTSRACYKNKNKKTLFRVGTYKIKQNNISTKMVASLRH